MVVPPSQSQVDAEEDDMMDMMMDFDSQMEAKLQALEAGVATGQGQGQGGSGAGGSCVNAANDSTATVADAPPLGSTASPTPPAATAPGPAVLDAVFVRAITDFRHMMRYPHSILNLTLPLAGHPPGQRSQEAREGGLLSARAVVPLGTHGAPVASAGHGQLGS